MGGAIMSAGDPPAGQPSPTRYVLDAMGFRLYDGTSTDYGAPSGAGVTFEARNDGTIFLSKGLTIQSAIAGAARFMIDMTGANPMLRISDGVVDRVQIGNLVANGVSPAQWGMRVNDVLGNPIFDSLGLISVLQIVGNTTWGARTDSTANTSTWTVTTGSSQTFLLGRELHALVLAQVTAKVTGTNNQAVAVITVDTINQNNSMVLFEKVNPGYTNAFLMAPLLLSGGSHTITFSVATDASTNIVQWGGQMISILMGT